MINREWLSVSEIARLWSDETGENAEALERDLDEWFSGFTVRQPSQRPGSFGREDEATNQLMGLLGGRHLQRETFAIYCEETGRDKPRFWFTDNAEDEEQDSPSPSDASAGAASIASGGASEPAAAPGLASGRLPSRKAVRLAGNLVLGLSLLAVGFVLGQGEAETPKMDVSVAEQDQLTAPLVSSLRNELEEAQQQIAKLSAALEVSEQEVEQLYTDLLVAQQALDLERDTGQFDTEVASRNLETNGCKASEQTLYVQADRVNVREGPGTSYGVKLQVNKGRSLFKLDRRGEWVWTTYDVGETTQDGWIHSSLVSTDCL